MIDTKQSGAVLEIIFNRPQKRNAIDSNGYKELILAFDQASADEEIKVVVLHGLGGNFTSGNDIQDFIKNPNFGQDNPLLSFLRRLANFKKVLLASVEGWAVGIGTTMLLHCDMVYAAQNASFQLPFIDLGLCPEAGSSYLLPRLIGAQKAAELLFTGRIVLANEAEQMGLVTQVLAPAQCLNYSLDQAQLIAAKPTQALLATKRLLRYEQEELLTEVIRQEAQEFTALVQSDQAKVAFTTFMSKPNR